MGLVTEPPRPQQASGQSQSIARENLYNIHRWLEAEGGEVYPAGITIWRPKESSMA